MPYTWVIEEMSLEFRVMNRRGELAIYEVYYRDDGTVQGFSADPTFPSGDTIGALRENCDQYLASLEKPVLDYDDS